MSNTSAQSSAAYAQLSSSNSSAMPTELPAHPLKQRLWEDKDFIKAYLAKNKNSSNLDLKYLNEDVAWLSVQHDLRYFSHMPSEYRHGKLAELVVQANAASLTQIPLKYRTFNLCRMALQRDPRLMGLIPLKYLAQNIKFFLKPEALNQQALFDKDLVTLANVAPEYLNVQGWKAVITIDIDYVSNVTQEYVAEISSWIPTVQGKLLNNDFDSGALENFLRNAEQCECLSDQLCLWAVSVYGHIIEHLPPEYKTDALRQKAVSESGTALEEIHEADRDVVLCILAIKQDPDALEFVPQEIRKQHPRLVSLALRKDGRAICYLTAEELTPEHMETALKQNGEAIQDIPETKWTSALIEMAVGQSYAALNHIPITYWSPRLLQLGLQAARAANKLKEGLSIIAKELVIEFAALNLADEASTTQPRISQATLTALLATTLQDLGLEANALSVEAKLIALIKHALPAPNDYHLLSAIPKQLWTSELIQAVLLQRESALSFIPKELWTAEWIKLALRQNGLTLGSISDSECTFEYCELAVSQNPLALEFVPERYRSFELCLKAVKANPSVLKYVPDHGDPARGWSIDEKFVEAIIHHFRPKTLFTPSARASGFFNPQAIGLSDLKINVGGDSASCDEPPAKRRRLTHKPSL